MFFEESLIFPSGGRSNYRIPSIVVTNDGSAFAFCNNRYDSLLDHAKEISLVYAVKRPGKAWSEVRDIAHLPGWVCNIGSAVYDDIADRIIIFGERKISMAEFGGYSKEELDTIEKRSREAFKHASALGIKTGLFACISDDNGKSWVERTVDIKPVLQKHHDGSLQEIRGITHGCSHGIRLRHGIHAGRLLCPSRVFIGEYHNWEEIKNCVYNNAIYSDDHGKTWQASSCVQLGTGEGTLIEREDGSILYNSRAYFRDGKRYLAVSTDGGATYGNFSTDPFLLEETRIGCNASFLRVELSDIRDRELLPKDARDVTLFCNPRAETRRRLTICISFNSGETYREARVIYEGPSAYSSIDYDQNSGHFFLMYENGDAAPENNPQSSAYTRGISIAEFDLEWLLSFSPHSFGKEPENN